MVIPNPEPSFAGLKQFLISPGTEAGPIGLLG